MPATNKGSHEAFSEDERPPAVGLLPAAGQARRVSPLPGSKELYPIGMQTLPDAEGPRPRVVSQAVLESMRAAGVDTVYWVLREGKWDIPAYWEDGHRLGLHFAYLMMRWPFGVPFTLDQAYPFVKDRVVLLGFPDLLFRPQGAYRTLRRELTTTGADVVLGCFPARNPHKVDVVDRAPDGRVRAVHVKPKETDLTEAWIIAAWGPAFTLLLHEWVAETLQDPEQRRRVAHEEHHLGHLFQRALSEGLLVRGVSFSDGQFIDIGTPESLRRVAAAGKNVLAGPDSTTGSAPPDAVSDS